MAKTEQGLGVPTPQEPEITIPTDLVEQVSAVVHEQWMNTKLSQGIRSRRSETGEELMAPYGQLSEKAKDLDRGSVVAVLQALTLAGRVVVERKPTYITDENHPTARLGVERCAYAAAHDIEPHEVDTTDGGYQDLARVIIEDYWEMLEVLSKAAGLPDDADFPDILEWITAARESRRLASGSRKDGETA